MPSDQKQPIPDITDDDTSLFVNRLRAQQTQRGKQQGRGRPIISALHRGYRFVAVGNKVLHSNQWKTFHDFLMDYIIRVIGRRWATSEKKKPFKLRHPLLQWHELVWKEQKAKVKTPGQVHTWVMTGASDAYLHLAYNLYLLAHNLELQDFFLSRLRNADQFYGACYEAQVAAYFTIAGFKLCLEPEHDPSTSHCEFTATSPNSSKSYSVEAKSRKHDKTTTAIGNQLYKALCKDASHTRIIFIDLNASDELVGKNPIDFCMGISDQLRNKENTLTIKGQIPPQAYIFITNNTYLYNLNDSTNSALMYLDGFNIDDFQILNRPHSLREHITLRDKHQDMFSLIPSPNEHLRIPSTFDGSIPELAFSDNPTRLLIGNKYIIPAADGTEVEGVLEDACVTNDNRTVYGIYRLSDGTGIIATNELTDAEQTAFKMHPDTFFGVSRDEQRKIADSVDLYDAMYETYKHSTRDKIFIIS